MTKDNVKKNSTSYRQIVKATSIFGGVQVFNILISIIRSKVMAILLGPAGIGIVGLFTSTTQLISSMTNFGLGISAVKDIAIAHETKNDLRIAKVVIVVKRLVWITGLLGALVTLFSASWLSQLTFGNKEYTVAFIWLSLTILLKQLTSGQYVLLQGLRKLKHLAKANMIGSALGLLASIPLYYYWRLDGIVPAIMVSAIFTFAVAGYYANKVKTIKNEVTLKETRLESKGMMLMGFMLSLSSIMVVGESYVIRIFINNTGGIDEVGLYNAGIALITTYVGLLFTAMETDYYPRLSAVSSDDTKVTQLINQQAEIAILILAPVITLFIIFVDWIIIILYSKQFIAINVMIYSAALAMFFKVVGWVIAFIFIAKGASKLFFWNELISNLYLLGLNLLGYYFWGLTGLGISFLISYLLYVIQVYLIAKSIYGFTIDSAFLKIFLFQFVIAVISVGVIIFFETPWTYVIGSIFILISGMCSFRELDKRLHLKEFLNNYKKK